MDGAAGGETPAVPVHVALARVMDEVQSISKASRNTQQNYNFRGIDAVVNAVGPAFRNHGMFCVPVRVELVGDERYVTKNDAHMRNITARIRWRFYGPAGDYIEAESVGEAADAGDKAMPKSSSVAYRTLLLQALCIPTDEADPDASSHERAVQRRQEGPPAPEVPTSWQEIEKRIKAVDNPAEGWELFRAFVRAASIHQYGKLELENQAEKDWLWQKAAGAVMWLQENTEHDGPFIYYDQDQQRRAWAHVLGGHALPIPDYEAPEPPGAKEALDAAEEEARAAQADEPPEPESGDAAD